MGNIDSQAVNENIIFNVVYLKLLPLTNDVS
jgi:hypothetical protein